MSPAMETIVTSRPAGHNERRCISRDNQGLYGWVAVTGEYRTTQEWEPQIVNALQHCLSTHAALSAVVKDATSKQPLIAQLDRVDVRNHLTILPGTSDDLEAGLYTLLQQVHHHELEHDGANPQWRLVVLPITKNDLTASLLVSFACSHVLFDGMSCYKFHTTLLEGLGSTGNVHKATQAGLPPPLDKAAHLPISWPFLLKRSIGEFLPGWLSRFLGSTTEVEAWNGAAERPSLPDKGLIPTGIGMTSLSPSELNKCLQLCRRHDCKLTSFFNYVWAKSLSEALDGVDRFRVEVPYDLRRCLAGQSTSMANYVSAIELPVEIHSSTPWEALVRDTQQLQRASSSLQDQLVALLQYLSDFDDCLRRRASQPASTSFSTSNLGNFAPATSTSNEWTVHEMVFSQSADATGAVLNVNLASSQGGKLWIVATWWPGMLGVSDEDAFIRGVCDSTIDHIQRMIAEDGGS